MSETSKAFLLSVISGIVAFGAAVLVLVLVGLTRADVQGVIDSQPATGLTRADVQGVIDSQPATGLTRADVQGMIDSQPTEFSLGNYGYEAMIADSIWLSTKVDTQFFALTDFALCADWLIAKWLTETMYTDASYRERDGNWENGVIRCREEAFKERDGAIPNPYS